MDETGVINPFTESELELNAKRPPVAVLHEYLERVSEEHCLQSYCPLCKIGKLLAQRNPISQVIEPIDVCINCHRRFEYMDILKIRDRDRPVGLRPVPVIKSLIPIKLRDPDWCQTCQGMGRCLHPDDCKSDHVKGTLLHVKS